jgi:hypothetical protein
MRRDIVVIGIVLFLIGIAINFVANNVLNEYGLDKLVVDFVIIIGLIYWFFSVLTIFIGIFLKDKKGIF